MTRKLLTVLLICAVPSPLAAQARIDDLAWLAGCWQRSSGDRVVQEQWSTARNGVMMGMGRTMRGGSPVEYEVVRIYTRGDSLVYAAQPSRQAPAEFVTGTTADGAATFSNPTHDFPQRVIYQQGAGDSLFARIEGTRNGPTRGVDFHMQRVSCPQLTGEAAVRALDSLWAGTYAAHDTITAAELFADDMLVIASNGQLRSKAQEMEDVRPFQGTVVDYFRSRDVDVRSAGEAAVVHGRLEWQLTTNGRAAQIRRRYTALWAPGGPRGWRMVALHIRRAE